MSNPVEALFDDPEPVNQVSVRVKPIYCDDLDGLDNRTLADLAFRCCEVLEERVNRDQEIIDDLVYAAYDLCSQLRYRIRNKYDI